jgi:hypothetical protein
MKICMADGCNKESHCKGFCERHYKQIKTYGKITIPGQRTNRDLNEFIVVDNICWVVLYNRENIEVARAKFCTIYYEVVKNSNLKWCLTNHGYAASTWSDEVGKLQQILLHQLIIQLSGQEVPDGYEIDHKDGNKLNCLDDNLRICTSSQNQHNREKRINNKSGFK